MGSPCTAYLWPARGAWCFVVLGCDGDAAGFHPSAFVATAAAKAYPITSLLIFAPSEVARG